MPRSAKNAENAGDCADIVELADATASKVVLAVEARRCYAGPSDAHYTGSAAVTASTSSGGLTGTSWGAGRPARFAPGGREGGLALRSRKGPAW